MTKIYKNKVRKQYKTNRRGKDKNKTKLRGRKQDRIIQDKSYTEPEQNKTNSNYFYYTSGIQTIIMERKQDRTKIYKDKAQKQYIRQTGEES